LRGGSDTPRTDDDETLRKAAQGPPRARPHSRTLRATAGAAPTTPSPTPLP